MNALLVFDEREKEKENYHFENRFIVCYAAR